MERIKSKNKNRRGDASIVATVILILSAIAIAVVVMTFSKESEQKVSEKIIKLGESVECEDVRLSVEKFEEPARFTLMNRGTLGIDKFIARIYQDGGPVHVTELSDFSNCAGAGVREKRLLPQRECVWNLVGYAPIKLELIPFIVTKNEELGCENRISIWEKQI